MKSNRTQGNPPYTNQYLGWYVMCSDWELGPYQDEESAQIVADRLESGAPCRNPHRLEERTVNTIMSTMSTRERDELTKEVDAACDGLTKNEVGTDE